MAAKRVTVIIAEFSAYMATQGGMAHEWRVEVLGTREALSRLAQAPDVRGSRLVCEAYSARDAHDVDCALRERGCTGPEASDDPTRTYIWLERVGPLNEACQPDTGNTSTASR